MTGVVCTFVWGATKSFFAINWDIFGQKFGSFGKCA
jgi:hypothetical protein